ncbi:MAG: radical SAM protein [Flavobacteriales bacterium]|nr:radical SAM protein [Flavobacteriales bacterium]
MKIVLTHGYFLQEDEKEREIMRPYPPLGLLYIAGYLRDKDIACEVFDATFETHETWKAFMLKNKPDIVLFYTNLMTKINVLKLNTWLKSILPNCVSVIGGPDVTYNLENYLQQQFDYSIIGEGEQTAHELIQSLSLNEKVDAISGLAYLKNGKLIQTDSRIKLKEMGELPLPARNAIPLEKYLSVWKKFHGKATANISTQRGCPYTCKWCSTAVYGQSYRRRPAKLVVDEIQLLQENYGVEALWFVDDVFTISHKWLASLHDEMNNRNIQIDFEIITRAERLNEEVLKMLKEMGCFRIWIGAESGSQRIIDAMDRRVSVKDVREKIKLTQQHGIEAGTFIMIGYPGETQEDIFETVNHLKLAPPDQFTITLAYPIKGTGLYDQIAEDIIEAPEWTTSTDRDINFKRSYDFEYYKHAIRYVTNSFHGYNQTKKGNRLKSNLHKIKAIVSLNRMKKISKCKN